MFLVRDLAVILISAGAFTIISKALKQPLILGYILAGILIGPHVPFFFNISSVDAVDQWSQIGIIFLMFGLGLEFSFKKLLKVGGTAFVTAGFKFIGVFILGFIVGQAMDWSVMESIFLGGLLSMSSTIVVIKSFDDLKLKNKPYSGMVFGTLVVEDLIAILLMVLLSTMAVSNKFSGTEMLFNIGKLIFFLVLWFLVGIYVLPTLFKKTRNYLSDEILLIVSVGLCFGMVALALAVGFSSALGAFVMGSILAETIESEHIERLVLPIKDLFGAIFFVSVGMMLDPGIILANWLIIILLALFVILTHIFFASAGVLATGKGLDNAIHTGFSLAQLGEFGFIIAGLGCSLGVMRDFIYPVIIAVSVITTFTTPYIIKLADPAYRFATSRLSPELVARFGPSVQTRTVAEQSEWKKLLKAYCIRILLYGVILVAILIGSDLYLTPFAAEMLPDWDPNARNILTLMVTLAVMSPFIYGIGISSGAISNSAIKLLKEKSANRWLILGLVLARTFIAIGFVLGAISRHFHLAGWAVVLILAAGAVFILFARHDMKRYSGIEEHFLSNLNEKEAEEKKASPVASSVRRKMEGYDVHIESMAVSQDSIFGGQKMRDIPFRSVTGANIIKIRRGSHDIVIPDGEVQIFPGDILVAVGTDAQMASLRDMMAESFRPAPAAKEDTFEVIPVTLGEDSYLSGQTLRAVNMRGYGCMVISVMRGGDFVTNPKPDYKFQAGDIVWIAGESKSCEWFNDAAYRGGDRRKGA